jgi:phenylalanyl-tRNA synthetase beta chain
MKISIAWIFDHIDARVQDIDIPALIDKLNETTAEIEQWQKIKTDLTPFALAQIKSITKDVHVEIPEWGKDARLPLRSDAKEGNWYLIIKEGDAYSWTLSTDLGGYKEMILPAIVGGTDLQDGSWKQSFETYDVIFTVDNKSITHRPDLWGHRGFAREVAAILDLKLLPLDDFILPKKVVPHEWSAKGTTDNPFSLSIKDPELCKRFAGYSILEVKNQSSLLWMAARLSRVDSRAIDALVDFTNYVMLDLSQPMHAFDAQQLASGSVSVRRAQNKEKLTLLDDQKIELTDQDLVVVDGDRPVSLAGIMGGKNSGIAPDTTAVFLESANFDAATIRRSSQRHKVRSESSARFEKSLDPNQNIDAIVRFLKLLEDARMPFKGSESISSLGPLVQPSERTVSHAVIEARLGVSIASSFIESTLRKLGFELRQEKKGDEIFYHIIVPTFRATKDVDIKEDIIEEIGRFYGWSKITPQLPYMQTRPKPVHTVLQTGHIKHLLSYGLKMRELYTYSFFDESFLKELSWDPGDTLMVKDPVSENWHRLVTTLIPNMFRAVWQNAADHTELQFYEWARSWSVQAGGTESKKLSGIFYSKKKPLNFYDCKAQLNQLFELLGMNAEWQTDSEQSFVWQDGSHTATLMVDGQSIGTAGFVDPLFMKKVTDGSAFIFELDASFLERYEKPVVRYKPVSKYPPIERDVSALAPLSITVAQMSNLISGVDERINAVQMVDIFEKKEWKGQRAITFRYTIQDATKTLTKPEADTISAAVHAVLEKAGAQIR